MGRRTTRKRKQVSSTPCATSSTSEAQESQPVISSKYFKSERSSKQTVDGENAKNSAPSVSAGAKADTQRLPFSFFDRPCEELAKALLGKKLVRIMDSDGEMLSGLIVETEAYLGGEDKAAHSCNGKKTEKNTAMYMAPGTIYVYHIYGLYTCINISSQGDGAAVLIRALDPIEGRDTMKQSRGIKRADKGQGLKEKELGNGPSKLTQALSIDKATFNKQDITSHKNMWLQDGDTVDDQDIVISSRIGVDYAGDWAKKPLRFYVRGNKSISVRDKLAEKELTECSGDK